MERSLTTPQIDRGIDEGVVRRRRNAKLVARLNFFEIVTHDVHGFSRRKIPIVVDLLDISGDRALYDCLGICVLGIRVADPEVFPSLCSHR